MNLPIRWVAWMMLAVLCCGTSRDGVAQVTLFANGFEGGLPACVSGVLSGDALPSPPILDANLVSCVQITNDLTNREVQRANGVMALPHDWNVQESDLQRWWVVDAQGQRRPVQWQVLSRWGRPLSDASAPIRWLRMQMAAGVESQAVVAVMSQDVSLDPTDSAALRVQSLGAQRFQIDTGAAIFEIDGTQAQPIRSIQLRDDQGGVDALYVAASASDGWQLRVAETDGTPVIDLQAGLGSLQPQQTRWFGGLGPIAAQVQIDGWLDAPVGATCGGASGGRRLPYSVALSFVRGQADIDLEVQLGNACGTPQSAPDSDSLLLQEFALTLPLARGSEAVAVPIVTSIGNPRFVAAGASEQHEILQARGSGTPWRREVSYRHNGTVVQSAERFDRPSVGARIDLPSGRTLVASIAHAWMAFREPQSLAVQGGALTLAWVSEPVPVGKAKSLWFRSGLTLQAFDSVFDAINGLTALAYQAHFRLERPLLLRQQVEDLDAAAVMPPLLGNNPSQLWNAYASYVLDKHRATAVERACTDAQNGIGSQWSCAKTYGQQIWPDIQFNEQFGFTENPDPASNEVKLNYWDPVQIELTEFLRGGDPRWAWEFALPQSWLMAYTAYYNFGRWPNATGSTSNIAGHSFGSGGTGDGLWHRSASGSADYTYNRHQSLAYVLWPSVAHQDRLAEAGIAAGLRFTNDPQDDTSWAAVGRLNLQYVQSLATCAEFVPGVIGENCDSRLREVLGHLITNSLSAGLICELQLQADASCAMGQYFMLYAWYYPILDRLYLNYRHSLPVAQADLLLRALRETPQRVLASLPRTAGGEVDVDAIWPNVSLCTLGGSAFDTVQNCSVVPDPDNLSQNKPATLSLLTRGRDWSGDPALCMAARQAEQALFSMDVLGPLRQTLSGGWWKGAVESGQELSTAALGIQRCPVSP